MGVGVESKTTCDLCLDHGGVGEAARALAVLVPLVELADVRVALLLVLVVELDLLMADEPAAKPSIPSVRLAPFDTAVTIKMTMGMKMSQA